MVMVRPKQSDMLVTAAGCRPFRLNITHCGGESHQELRRDQQSNRARGPSGQMQQALLILQSYRERDIKEEGRGHQLTEHGAPEKRRSVRVGYMRAMDDSSGA